MLFKIYSLALLTLDEYNNQQFPRLTQEKREINLSESKQLLRNALQDVEKRDYHVAEN